MKKLILPILTITLTGFVSSCASTAFVKAYPGAERPAAQLATVVVPASVEVRSANGEKLPNVTGMLRAKQYTIATLPGPQDWSVRYYQPLAEGYYADPSTVTDSPWTPLQFAAVAGQTYRLSVETPRENPKLRNASEQVCFSIVAEQKAVSTQPSAISQPKAEPPVLVVTPVAPPTPAKSAEPPPPPPALKAEVPQTIESATLQQLQNWWRAAGPQERQAFRDWIKTQP